ncbi:hypothetical protein EV644_12986 [Kribbella orskensis]|uniref:Uncharacterized protein n=1 Tax=Kribbella orskensis TaxID=2512216 RepID=A0ABY2B976_9ACTN|nr:MULTISPECIES: hypothetical protein [Kribbella]TCN31211.1 hypothetical protein EV642_13186 [Kribbella sp. VKM Ac-2500]TCO11717.1 hypothetical protein EV644_12986 [Kribbella orskensis]
MRSVQQRSGELWVLMHARRLGLGRNPLRRPVDRLEAGFVLLALVACLLTIPVGAAVGTSVRKAGENHAAQQRSSLQAVQARTIEDAPTGIGDVPGQLTWPVGVVWQDPAGMVRESRTKVYLGTMANSEVTIWLDRSGQVVKPPASAGESAALGGGVGLGTVLGSWLLLWLLTLAVRRPLDRRRLREWAGEWEQVAPDWTRRDQ